MAGFVGKNINEWHLSSGRSWVTVHVFYGKGFFDMRFLDGFCISKDKIAEYIWIDVL